MNPLTLLPPAAQIGLAEWQKRYDALTPEQRAAVDKEAEEDGKRRSQAAIDRQNEQRAKEVLARANLPKRQLLRTDLDLSGPWKEKLDGITGKLGTGFLIALVGNRGNGKTQMAVEIARASVAKGRAAYYATATTFFMAIKGTYRKEAEETESDVIAEYQKPGLLIVDEIGSRSESDWENRLMMELFNRRYADMTDTLLLDNQTPEEFSKAIGPSLTSRMNEAGGIIHCDWPSYRK